MHVVVVGAGLVGAAAALQLAIEGHQVTVLERTAPAPSAAHWDLRISSVHQRNVEWLQKLGVWTPAVAAKAFPFIGLSVQGQDGQRVEFAAPAASSMGYMVENQALQYALWEALAAQPRVTLRTDFQLQQLELEASTIYSFSGEALAFDLLLGADGAQSKLASLAGIGRRGWDYGQRCMLANVTTVAPILQATWEIFRRGGLGPMALLPLGTQQACLIDYRPSAQWQNISAQGAEAVARELKQTFAPHIGAFELLELAPAVPAYASFPIQRQHALTYTRAAAAGTGLALIGDAAHSIHPLAGQGVNLGFADVQCLVAQVSQSALASALTQYERERLAANQQMMRAMDAIHFGFGSHHWLPRVGVAGLLGLLSKMPGIQRQVVRMAMGETF